MTSQQLVCIGDGVLLGLAHWSTLYSIHQNGIECDRTWYNPTEIAVNWSCSTSFRCKLSESTVKHDKIILTLLICYVWFPRACSVIFKLKESNSTSPLQRTCFERKSASSIWGEWSFLHITWNKLGWILRRGSCMAISVTISYMLHVPTATASRAGRRSRWRWIKKTSNGVESSWSMTLGIHQVDVFRMVFEPTAIRESTCCSEHFSVHDMFFQWYLLLIMCYQLVLSVQCACWICLQ